MFLPFRWLGFAGGPKVVPVFRTFFVSDRDALRGHLQLRRARGWGTFPSMIRVFGLFAALVWVWSVCAGQLHELRAIHAVCAEHGHLVDVAASTDGEAHDDAPGPTVRAATAIDDHGCVIEVLVPLEPSPVVLLRAVHRLAFPLVDPLAARQAPRGPPLAYAPKTSPPALV
jgi:hypothetical protein